MKLLSLLLTISCFIGPVASADEIVYARVESNDLVAARCGPTVGLRLDTGALWCLPTRLLEDVEVGSRYGFVVSFANNSNRRIIHYVESGPW